MPKLPFLRPTAPATVFLPADRFFVRVVPIAPDSDATEQVELALEGLAPFPLSQLYWGYLLSGDRTRALVYAAHRRRFSPEETKPWRNAGLVIPTFLPLASRPAPGSAALLHSLDSQLAGAAWSAGTDALPTLMLVRGFAAEPTVDERKAFGRDLVTRAGLPPMEPRLITGMPTVERSGDRIRVRIGDVNGPAIDFPADQVDQVDVRDREFLAERREQTRRGDMLWRVLLAGSALIAAGLALDLVGLVYRNRGNAVQATVTAQAPTVQRLQTADSLAKRVDELATQRLLPFEMLVLVNDKRPGSIQFVRTTTKGPNTLEVEAQTGNAGDVTNFEQALQGAPGIAQVNTRDIRARDGMTSFVITITFKPDTLRAPAKGSA
ncbi:MAG TPA: hypothetical protein VHD32_11155 [Candidatus Didemnitutus sp.]|nr:hypothetical protein [Candidatus Didemnitutus sp.]